MFDRFYMWILLGIIGAVTAAIAYLIVPNDSGQSEYWRLQVINDDGTLEGTQGDRTVEVQLHGIIIPYEQQAAAAARMKQLTEEANYQAAIVPVQRGRGYIRGEVFLLQPDSEEEILLQQELLTSGLSMVNPEQVDQCPNGEQMKNAEAIAQELNLGVWAATVLN